MGMRIRSLIAVALAVAIGFVMARVGDGGSAAAQPSALSALDYQEITQLINRYAYGIDTCADNGYDYADVFTTDGVFIDRNSDAGFAAGGRVLAQGREALATLVGGGSRGCATKLVWTDWSHLMLNHEITPSAEGATGRVYLVQLGMDGPGSVARHGGYEDVYVRTPEGWRIKSRTHVRNKAWHSEKLRTPDLN
ncbi:MAG TPA: nuclear transport factor 2 family protein [Gammaproteobacteria bacterium]|nr:nuclear transport factor 2 family protein [Gammaproteobacteria bacterium]